jgi:phage host-nuclease inhibitor protein Gam
MAKTREKKIVVTGVSREQFEQAFAEYAAADAKFQNVTTKMDIEITRIREKYQEQISTLQEQKDKAVEMMQTYAMENKDELFSKRKSIETVHGMVGFRTGTPKLRTLKGFTWAAVTTLLSEFLPEYVRTTTEPAKDKLIADRDNEEVSKYFTKVGIDVVQDETFYVEPKKEATE